MYMCILINYVYTMGVGMYLLKCRLIDLWFTYICTNVDYNLIKQRNLQYVVHCSINCYARTQDVQ